MVVIRHVIDGRKTVVLAGESADWSVERLDSVAGTDGLGPLVLACQADPSPGPRVSLAGLRAELAAREGREAVAFTAVGVPATPGAELVGLAVVIEATAGRGRRFSLAWLLVHPAVRRQGVATALLARAFAHVTSRGGTEIHVETLGSWPDAVAFWHGVAGRAGLSS